MNNSGHRKRLRKKYQESGFEALLDYEQIELLLTYIISRRDVKPIAKNLIDKYENLEGIVRNSHKLTNIDGLGEGARGYFSLLGDISKQLFKTEYSSKELTTIGGTIELIRFLRNSIGGMKVEEFKVIFLNNSNNLIDEETLSRGTIDRSAVYLREVVERVIHHKAKSIILAHNHPSGSLKPSRADIDITLKLKEILGILEVRVLDHIIITKGSYYSMLEEGILN